MGMPKSSTERKRLQRQRDAADPDRKHRKLDTLFMFGCVDVAVIIDENGDVWFKGVDLARALEMEDPNTAIYRYIAEEYTISYEQLLESRYGITERYRDIPNIHPKTTFVNEMGMNLFVLRSRMPKAEAFAKWVCGEVLPSIRKSGRYEIDSDNNPYRELNEHLKKELENLKLENREIKTEMKEVKGENKQLTSAIIKANEQLFNMKPSCIMPITSDVKEEYFVVYRKFDWRKLDEIKNSDRLCFPYYVCRVQLDSFYNRRKELKNIHADLQELLRLKVPNSVNFFNYALSELSHSIERGRKNDFQSFRILGQCEKNFIEQERVILEMLKNIHRNSYGSEPCIETM